MAYRFDFDVWIKNNTPKQTRSSVYWDDIHLEYDEILDEFKSMLFSKETIIDDKGNNLTPLQLYNRIEYYKERIEKLMLIFNLRVYQSNNENKKTGVKYVVIRANWIDHTGKLVRWFSKNLGPESKVKIDGKIPIHFLDAAEEYILYLMWDQYQIEYLGGDEITTWDDDGNQVIFHD
jgi:hypothetical protein